MVRNENVIGFEAILRISVAKLVMGFFEYKPLLGNLGHFVDCFLTGGGRWVNCIKKRTDSYQFINQALLGGFSILDIWIKY